MRDRFGNEIISPLDRLFGNEMTVCDCCRKAHAVSVCVKSDIDSQANVVADLCNECRVEFFESCKASIEAIRSSKSSTANQ